jgi:ferrous iron transport protein B
MDQIALVGKPNSGKSSLFNVLTGLNQKIGNYSGVTVERRTGVFQDVEIIDLPGIKSLLTVSPEEQIAKDAILNYSKNQSPIIFVVNGLQLEDNLIFFTEIADLQIPCAIVINFKDDLDKQNVTIDLNKLKNQFGCPIYLMNSRTGDGIEGLKVLVNQNKFNQPNAICRSQYDSLENGVLKNSYLDSVSSNDNKLGEENFLKRKSIISGLLQSALKQENPELFLQQSKRWDKFLIHPVFGILTFLLTMLIVFQAVFYLSGFPMDWIDGGFAWLSSQVNSTISNEGLASFLSDGILAGLGGVLIFIPQIAILFFLLGVLEHSGYLARISFISNRFLSNFGLSGQSIIPLMSSWACAIPAIMSARVINDPKERMAVMFAAPLMTCSARLPVYTILIGIMFPDPSGGFFNIQGVTLLALYLIGTLATLLVAWLASKRSKIKGNSLWSLELPIYRIPNWRNVFYNMYLKTKAFVIDAGKVIFIVSIALWLLANFSPKGKDFLQSEYQVYQSENPEFQISKEAFDLEYSYAGYLGKVIEPVIKPLGYDWKIGIALISSFAAREVFVGALSTIYSVGSEEEDLIKNRMQKELKPNSNDKRFDMATCISLLLFYVFAMQCMSTMAIVRKEMGSWKYAIWQFILFGLVAYLVSFGAYQLLS